MSNELIIRPVEKPDFESWQALWQDYNAFYGREGKTALATEIIETTWSRFFDAYEPVYAFVAEEAGSLLGLVHFLYHRSMISIAPSCYLQDLFTIESARGKGVGRHLIQAVYDHAYAAGSSRVYWHTQETNETAMKLYDKVADHTEFIVYSKTLK
ncbi:MAG: GNAT family N-acetyltransferase [Deinococcota bacterium]